MSRFRLHTLALAVAAGAFLPVSAVVAQTNPSDSFQSPILTLDQERLFDESLWGKRASARIEAASTALAAENRQIESDLTAEEKVLTEMRATMPTEEFRKAADDFDARVTEIRRTQDGKARAISRIHDAERQRFYSAALPVMAEALRSHGAVVVLDSRAIFLASDAIDATDELIARIDAELGAGEDVVVPDEPDVSEPAGPVQPGASGTDN